MTATLLQPARWIAGSPIETLPTAENIPTKLAIGGSITLPAGSRFAVRVETVEPRAAATDRASLSPIPSALLKPGQVIQGVISGATPQGQPLLQTAVGTMVLAGSGASPGSVLTVVIVGDVILPMAEAASPLPALSRDGILKSLGWPALDETLNALGAANPTALQHLLDTVLPRPDSRLAAAILFFLSTLRSAGPRAWFGEVAASTLEKSRPEVWSRLTEDFRQLERMVSEPTAGDWRLTQIPLFHDSDTGAIRLLIRDQRRERPEKGESDSTGTRFILDFSLSRAGRVQLDGLVKASGRRFDLVVRTEFPLPALMQDDIRSIFRDASELRGLAGGIGFQATPPDFVEPSLDIAAGRNTELIV